MYIRQTKQTDIIIYPTYTGKGIYKKNLSVPEHLMAIKTYLDIMQVSHSKVQRQIWQYWLFLISIYYGYI